MSKEILMIFLAVLLAGLGGYFMSDLVHRDTGAEYSKAEHEAAADHELSGGAADDLIKWNGTKFVGMTPAEARTLLRIIDKNTFDANTILKADSDNTPAALSVPASSVVGRRSTGGICTMSMSELESLLAGKGGVRTASFVIAASNSSARDKAQADVVCDGVSDEEEIQAKLNLCNGGNVILLPGTYNLSGYIYIHSDGTQLLGCGIKTILDHNNSDDEQAILIDDKDNVRVAYLKLDKNQTEATSGQGIEILGSSGVEIDHCEITGVGNWAIDFGWKSDDDTHHPCNRVWVHHNYIHDTPKDGVHLFATTDGWVHDNLVTKTGDDGIAVTGTSDAKSARVHIYHNTINDVGTNRAILVAVEDYGDDASDIVTEVLVENNIVHTAAAGFMCLSDLAAGTRGCLSHLKIINNMFVDCTNNGIHCEKVEELIISDNTIDTTEGRMLVIRDSLGEAYFNVAKNCDLGTMLMENTTDFFADFYEYSTAPTASVARAGRQVKVNGSIWVVGSDGSYIIKERACRATTTETQSIPNETWTTINFPSEYFDTDALHDNSTNNSRMTCPADGTYLLTAHIEWADNGTGSRKARIMLNGETNICQVETPPVNNTAVHNPSTFYKCSADDYFEVQVYQSSGGALNLLKNAQYACDFEIIQINQ